MRSVSPKERAWRARNPALAARFDKLPAGARANIRTAAFSAGTAKLVRSADVVRRETEAARSQSRRERVKPGGAYGYVKARTPQQLKYKTWMVDEFGNVRATEESSRPPGDIIGQTRYEDSQSGTLGSSLTVVAVTVK